MKTVWIPGEAYCHALECIDPEKSDLMGEAIQTRNYKRGRSSHLVKATTELAKWFRGEAEFWSGHGVDPDSKWRVRPCRVAAKRIEKALEER